MKRSVSIAMAAVGVLAVGVIAPVALSSELSPKQRAAKLPSAARSADGPVAAEDSQYKQVETAFQAKLRDWLDSPQAQALDIAGLPRGDLAAAYGHVPTTLAKAVAQADRIVVARVSNYRFGSWGSSISVVPELTLKGPVMPNITVQLPGGPRPTDMTFTSAVLGQSEGAPVLLPGKRAVFFLKSESDGGLGIENFSGQYEVVGGSVQPVPSNPFGDSIRGMSLADFVTRIRQAG